MPVADPAELSAITATLRAAGCVFAEDEAALLAGAAADPAGLRAMTARRAGGEPLELVLGYAQFCGLRIAVEPGVFIPRRRTESLARIAARLLAAAGTGGVLVDVCCGSGAIAAAVLTLAGVAPAGRSPAEPAAARAYASDIDPVAVRCARRNLEPLGGVVYQGDLFGPLPAGLAGRVSVLTANVPYVPGPEIALLPAEARDYEARVALDGGADGLDVLRQVAAAAPAWLAPGGVLLTEVSERQLDLASAIVTEAGLRPAPARDDELGATVLTATAA